MKVKLPTIKKPNIKLIAKVLGGITVVVLVTLLVGAVANEAQDREQTKSKQHQAELVAAEKRGYEKGTADRTQYVTRDALWRLECKKADKLYEVLTPTQKRLLPVNLVPNCGQAILNP